VERVDVVEQALPVRLSPREVLSPEADEERPLGEVQVDFPRLRLLGELRARVEDLLVADSGSPQVRIPGRAKRREGKGKGAARPREARHTRGIELDRLDRLVSLKERRRSRRLHGATVLSLHESGGLRVGAQPASILPAAEVVDAVVYEAAGETEREVLEEPVDAEKPVEVPLEHRVG